MHRFFGRFVSLASGRLLIANLVLLIALKVLVPLGSNNLADISAPSAPVDVAAVVTDTNDARHAAGLAALDRNAVLDRAAQARLDDMAQKDYFAHQSPDGRMPWDFIATAGYHYKSAGENLARGFYDPAVVVDAWMASPTHRANILNTIYRDIGVAAGRTTLNGRTSMVIVELYGTPATKTIVVPHTAADTRISTDVAIAPVPEAITPQIAGASISTDASGWLAIWVSAVLGTLTLAVGWIGAQRRLLYAWGANLAILALLVLVPAVSTSLGRIW